MHTKVSVRCVTCQRAWDASPYKLLEGHKCKMCALKTRNLSHAGHKKTHKEFLDDLIKINQNIKILSPYYNAKTYVQCECTECGNIWKAKPTNLLSGYGCPECGERRAKSKQLISHEEFINSMSVINPDAIIKSKYNGYHSYVRCLCKNCGYEWFAMPLNLMRKDGNQTGCPKCSKSHGERAIQSWLDNHCVLYEPQKKFDNLVGVKGRQLSYDFYLPLNDILIEYQGEFHDGSVSLQSDEEYEMQVEHDARKKYFAANNNYYLFEIWYYENINDKLIELSNLITYPVTTTEI